MKPTLEWSTAAVARLGYGATLGGGNTPDAGATFVVTPSRMTSPVESGALGAQIVTSQVDITCYTLQTQDSRIASAAREVWTRSNSQVEQVHQLGALDVEGVILAAPTACDFQLAEPGEPWHIAATVTMELTYMRSLVAGA